MTKRLTAKTGEYQKDGETKGRFTNIGALLENSNGEYILLDPSVNLAGILIQQNAMSSQPRTSVMVSIFSDDRNQVPKAPQASNNMNQARQQPDAFDTDAPF